MEPKKRMTRLDKDIKELEDAGFSLWSDHSSNIIDHLKKQLEDHSSNTIDHLKQQLEDYNLTVEIRERLLTGVWFKVVPANKAELDPNQVMPLALHFRQDILEGEFDPEIEQDEVFKALQSLLAQHGSDEVLNALQQVYAKAAINNSSMKVWARLVANALTQVWLISQ